MQNGQTLPNGLFHGQTSSSGPDIIRALEVVHDPRSSNDTRADASRYLERLTDHDEAPYNGFLLASEKGNPPVVRHFGLSLLENTVRLRWLHLSAEQKDAVRGWVVKLAQSVAQSDASYVRNKVAHVWVEIAKRSWALDWLDMDERLVEIWTSSTVQKMLVMEVLETLSENSFGKEDAITALRGPELNKACVEVFTPHQVIARHFPERDAAANTRYGSEGWLARIADLLAWCLQQEQGSREAQACAQRALTTLRSAASWVIPVALAETQCIQRACQLMMRGNGSTQLAAIEMLSALYARYSIADADVRALVGPLFEDATIDGLRRLYEWTIVDSENIDDERYLLSKKLSELLHNAGRYIKECPEDLFDSSNALSYLQLLLQVLRNDSLHVSIPALHLWVQILASPVSGAWEATMACIAPLLEICSQRLIRYELLPSESNVPTITFLNEDIDTQPERHAFLGNYARFCRDVVDAVVEKRPHEAFSHILDQTTRYFHDEVHSRSVNRVEPVFDPSSFTKSSMAVLQADAQCSVVEAGLQGYYRRRNSEKMRNNMNGNADERHSSATDAMESWSQALMELHYDDPAIRQRVLTMLVEFAVNPLRRKQSFIIRFFQHLLEAKAQLLKIDVPRGAHLFGEVTKEFQRFCSLQLQRVAKRCPDILLEAFTDIENAISQYCGLPEVDDDDKERCVTVLLLIIMRATRLDQEQRMKRLEAYVGSTIRKWQDPRLGQALQSFDGFCNVLGLSGFNDYFIKHKALSLSDWSDVPLDEEGLALKARVDAAQQELPLRATKTFFSATIDKVDEANPGNGVSIGLWSKYVSDLLPNLLQFISLDHLFSEPSSWNHASPDTHAIAQRILKDRWWQVGISSGSRDEFYSKVEQSKTSLEGLASAIRGSLRFVRETSYKLVSSMAYLHDSLYTVEGLPEPLSKAIFEHAGALSIHQNAVIIEMMRTLIERCPPEKREYFLTPLVTAMFDGLDHKIRAEWDVIDRQNQSNGANGSLVDEMKNESVLRQLTYNCVTIVIRILDPHDSMHHFPHTILFLFLLKIYRPPSHPS